MSLLLSPTSMKPFLTRRIRAQTTGTHALRISSSQRTLRRRCFSSTNSAHAARNPYPFPNSPEPTPYQIFHLMPDASPADVKQRYYELVRLYHPDSAESQKYEPDAAQRHARFSAITRAYTRLQKRAAGETTDADLAEGLVNTWKRTPSMHKRRYDEPRFVDDRWKDRLIWGILGFSLISVAAQTIIIRRRRFQELADHVNTSERVPLPTNWRPPEKYSDDDTLRLRRPPQ